MGITKKVCALLLLIAGLFIAVATFLAAVNGVLRYSVGTFFPWSEEFCTYLVVLLVFFVQPWLEITDDQLCIGLLNPKSVIVRKTLFIGRGIITLFLFGLLAYYGTTVVERTYMTKAVTYVLQIPRYILYAITTGTLILVVLGWLAVIFLNKGEKAS